jgi:hypothetical protein
MAKETIQSIWIGGKKTPSCVRNFTYYITPSRTRSLNERVHIHAGRNQFTRVGKPIHMVWEEYHPRWQGIAYYSDSNCYH